MTTVERLDRFVTARAVNGLETRFANLLHALRSEAGYLTRALAESEGEDDTPAETLGVLQGNAWVVHGILGEIHEALVALQADLFDHIEQAS